jgi:N-acetylated-alpha-linked acidic dipeptidase
MIEIAVGLYESAAMRVSTPLALAGLSLGIAAAPLAAQSLRGYTDAASGPERALEARLATYGDSVAARESRRHLSAGPHVAGTPAQQATAAYVLRAQAGMGLDTSRADFQAFLPFPESTLVELRTPVVRRLALEEPAIAGDPTTALPPWRAMNAYAGAGDVTAPLVYVNYGLAADYAVLDSLGTSVRGRVVIARYGRSYRGIKVREAESRGAVAVLLYSDPQDDGYARGDVYPEGPFRNPDGVQRGSVFNGEGDPSTPLWASVPGARRLPEDSMAIPGIPVVPLGYRNAALLLQPLRGASVPQGWQGGLPFRYHVGAGGVTARVALWRERGTAAYKRITDTFGTLRGTTWPEELVIVGGHRDAWGPGARDNVGGTAAVLEAARAWGRATAEGSPPRRTLVFATWDAEEWGLTGSAEWAESLEQKLVGKVVAYINLDDAADGRRFGAAGTATLQGVVRDATRLVRQPGETVSVYSAWRRAQAIPDSAEPAEGDLGGGSDYASFYNHLGLPAVDIGFGGAPAGSYHSAYDTDAFQDRFGDPGGLSIVAAGRIAALIMARLGNADIIPYDYAALASYLRRLAGATAADAVRRGVEVNLDPVRIAADSLAAAGAALNRRLANLPASAPPAGYGSANRFLLEAEPSLTRTIGLPGRPWQRNLIFAADRDDGYADVPFPGIAEAIRDRLPAAAGNEVDDLASRLMMAAGLVVQATSEVVVE